MHTRAPRQVAEASRLRWGLPAPDPGAGTSALSLRRPGIRVAAAPKTTLHRQALLAPSQIVKEAQLLVFAAASTTLGVSPGPCQDINCWRGRHFVE